MGHYASEMGYTRSDKWNYKRVNDLGFTSIHMGDLRVCPICRGLVRGQEAEEHWEWHQAVS
jgi:hypothetical protein